MHRKRTVWFLALGMFMAAGLLAQVVISSTIVGTVTDAQGAVIAGATVNLRNLDTGVESKTTTNTSGDYQLPNLLAGHYQVRIHGEGFADVTSTSISLENGTTRRVNVALKVGQVAEVVDVSSAAGIVKTDDANVSKSSRTSLSAICRSKAAAF